MKINFHHNRFRYLALATGVATLLALSSCATVSYYSQSVAGQMDIWWNKERIDRVLARPDISPDLRDKLTRATAIRHYASETLHLPKNDSYHYYLDLGRNYVVWNIFAAPEFSLEPKQWCYPVVGCASYRGYFSEQDAKNFANELEQQGLDVFLGGIPAYSTLGWFTDPLLNTMMRWSEPQLAGLIFHELTHQVIYIKSDAEFNEALATAVEQIGTLAWLREHHPEKLEKHLTRIQQRRQFRDLLLSTRQELIRIYASGKMPDDMREEKKRAIEKMKSDYAQLKASWNGDNAFDSWFDLPVNNARLVSVATYLERVPAFYSLFVEQNRDWVKFYAAAQRLGELEPEARAREVEVLGRKGVTLEQTL